MIGFNIARTVAIAAVVAAAVLPRIAAAQTASDSDTSVVEDAPPDVVDAPVPDVAAQDAPPAQAMPEYAASRFYLRRLEFVRSGWANLEYGYLNVARQQRLGALNPTVARGTAT